LPKPQSPRKSSYGSDVKNKATIKIFGNGKISEVNLPGGLANELHPVPQLATICGASALQFYKFVR